MSLTISGANYCGLKPLASGTSVFHTFSCREQRENKDIFHQITPEELEEILQKANDAAEKYALTPIANRRKFLQRIIDLLEENRVQLIKQFCQEASLSAERGNIELSRTQRQIKVYLDFISKENWNTVESQVENGVSFSKKLFPIGPVVVFGASNFPFAYSTVGGDTASALAAGNPVIYKSNPFHAGVSELTSQLVLQAAKENDIPDGVFSLLQGTDYWVGEKLVKDERVKAVGFTGSVRGGVALLNYAKERKTPIPVFCEMGSLNPTFIFDDAFTHHEDEMVEKLSHAITNDGGQFCTKPGLIFVQGDNANGFISKMKGKMKTYSSIPLLHPNIYHAFEKLKQPFEEFEIARKEENATEFSAQPQLVVMTAYDFLHSKAAKEEVFGPFSILVRCQNEAEMKTCMRALQGHLTASFWSDKPLSDDWMYIFSGSVGRIIKNGVSTGVAVIDSMHHGGNFPSTSDNRFTAVGKDAIYRFLQPVTLQNFE